MPSGNATYTYTGTEPIEVSGQVFQPGKPTPVTDQGVIAQLQGRKDFTNNSAPKPAAPTVAKT